jgi:hypothetical protein
LSVKEVDASKAQRPVAAKRYAALLRQKIQTDCQTKNKFADIELIAYL